MGICFLAYIDVLRLFLLNAGSQKVQQCWKLSETNTLVYHQPFLLLCWYCQSFCFVYKQAVMTLNHKLCSKAHTLAKYCIMSRTVTLNGLIESVGPVSLNLRICDFARSSLFYRLTAPLKVFLKWDGAKLVISFEFILEKYFHYVCIGVFLSKC